MFNPYLLAIFKLSPQLDFINRVHSPVSITLPQEIIEHIIVGVVDRNDRDILKACSLISHYFLRPSRKQLFADIYVRRATQCDKLHTVLARNPYIQTFIQSLNILFNRCPDDTLLCNTESLITILQLPLLCCLRSLRISSWSVPLMWDNINYRMRHALWVTIHCSSLTKLTLYQLNIPVTLLFDTQVRTLGLEGGSLKLSDRESLDSQTRVLSSRIEHCIWRFCERQDSLYFCYPVSEQLLT
jgi:hypothetical protein